MISTVFLIGLSISKAVDPITELEVGPNGSNQVSGSYSGAIGQSNSVGAGNSLGVGNSQTIWGTTNSAFGYGNTAYSGSYSLLSGSTNWVNGSTNTLFGTSNTVNFDSEEGTYPVNNLLLGSYNYVYGSSNSLLAGENNYGGDGIVASALIGRGLISYWSYAAVVGSYNATPSGDLRFVVGSGDSVTRSNALEVYADGTVIIPKAQGDILMGEFGN